MELQVQAGLIGFYLNVVMSTCANNMMCGMQNLTTEV